MTIEDARKILDISENELSDDQIIEHIKTATFFKDIFFCLLKDGKLNTNVDSSVTLQNYRYRKGDC